MEPGIQEKYHKILKSFRKSMNEKIIFLLEKVCQIMKSQLWEVGQKHHLSPLQIQVLLQLKDSSRKSQRVSIIACELGMTRATVSEAVGTLKEKGYLMKRKDQKDGRSFLLELTDTGRNLVQKELLQWKTVLVKVLDPFPLEKKEEVFFFLSELLAGFQREGIVHHLKMCLSCRHFERNIFPDSDTPHRCRLTGRLISNFGLNVKCESNVPKERSESEKC